MINYIFMLCVLLSMSWLGASSLPKNPTVLQTVQGWAESIATQPKNHSAVSEPQNQKKSVNDSVQTHERRLNRHRTDITKLQEDYDLIVEDNQIFRSSLAQIANTMQTLQQHMTEQQEKPQKSCCSRVMPYFMCFGAGCFTAWCFTQVPHES